MSSINSLSLSAQHSIHQTQALHPTSSSGSPPGEKAQVLVAASKVDKTLDIAFNIAETLGLQPLQSEVEGPMKAPYLSSENVYPIKFSFPPDNPDGTYSAELQQKISRFREQLPQTLRHEGIEDFGPDMFT
ncbi:hypothetical protein NUV89_08925 [Pseudomonas sp. 18.1.10]|uniref:hypothetical protein n=1 Tax=Pseudomonas sp. 18.1.10 TaxID=2969302 RepID=UPI00214FC335|nr:hypothetical protein [Pseudomonas sp. 18.1.10]MCR4538512.1 hypothetical protein [Pseudomonas sp. 18.1.10]